jgi:hypothetical protein
MPKTSLSASRIKTALSCSWKYHASYVLKLPDRGNLGSSLGGVTHIVLESLSPEKRRKLVQDIIAQNTFLSFANVKRLAEKNLRKINVLSDENLAKIDAFVLNGLKSDFYGDQAGHGIPVETYTELAFASEEDNKKEYKYKGFIDRLFIYADGHALIRDYKSSKEVYKGEEATSSNLQASIYALAVKLLFPHVKSISVEFLFLKFDCTLESKWETKLYRGSQTKGTYHNGGGKITLHYEEDEILGLESYLASVQIYMDLFTEQDAAQNLAANQPPPEDGSFGGSLCCGFATYPNQTKKDGNPMFACSAKFGFEFFEISDEKERKASCFLDEEEAFARKYPKDKYKWELKKYDGCPKWKKRT